MQKKSKDQIIAEYRLRLLYVEDILGVSNPEEMYEKLESTVLNARKVPLLRKSNNDLCAQLNEMRQKLTDAEDERDWFKESWLNDRRRPEG